MANLRQEGAHASTETDWILTYRNLSEEGKRVVNIITRSLLMKGCLCLGRAGGGKTPFVWTLGFAISRYQHYKLGMMPVRASIRTASDPELFKDEVGRKEQPWILDDFDIHDMKPKELKALFTVTAKENCVKVRYSFTKKVKGQVVLAADNIWDESAEPPKNTRDVKETAFLAMIAPAFPNWSKTNLEAILKRMNIVVIVNMLYIFAVLVWHRQAST